MLRHRKRHSFTANYAKSTQWKTFVVTIMYLFTTYSIRLFSNALTYPPAFPAQLVSIPQMGVYGLGELVAYRRIFRGPVWAPARPQHIVQKPGRNKCNWEQVPRFPAVKLLNLIQPSLPAIRPPSRLDFRCAHESAIFSRKQQVDAVFGILRQRGKQRMSRFVVIKWTSSTGTCPLA